VVITAIQAAGIPPAASQPASTATGSEAS